MQTRASERALSNVGRHGGGGTDRNDQGTAPWEKIVPLNEIPNVDPFPLDVLPFQLRGFVTEVAEALNCPPDYIAVPLLACSGGCIGNSRSISITGSHVQGPSLFTCVVGSKGTAKSPALNLVCDPIDKIQLEYQQDWELAMVGWEQLNEKERGPKPIMRRCTVGDITTETLTIKLGENPRGMILKRDELAGFLASMNQYKQGGGHDRQWYLELWTQKLSPRDRKSDGMTPVLLESPMVSIVGGTQPDVVGCFRGESRRGVPAPDDGWVDRWLFTMPDELPAKGETWLEVSDTSREAWAITVREMLNLHGIDDAGVERPYSLKLSATGRDAWKRVTDNLATDRNRLDFPEYLTGYWSKLRGYCARLSLILHVLHTLDGGAKGDVDGFTVDSAARLVKYFQAHARRVYLTMETDARAAGAKKILAWVKRERRRTFKRHEAHSDLRSERWFPTPESLNGPLELLADLHVIREQSSPERHGPGRLPAPTFEVNPALWDHHVIPANPENSRFS